LILARFFDVGRVWCEFINMQHLLCWFCGTATAMGKIRKFEAAKKNLLENVMASLGS